MALTELAEGVRDAYNNLFLGVSPGMVGYVGTVTAVTAIFYCRLWQMKQQYYFMNPRDAVTGKSPSIIALWKTRREIEGVKRGKAVKNHEVGELLAQYGVSTAIFQARCRDVSSVPDSEVKTALESLDTAVRSPEMKAYLFRK